MMDLEIFEIEVVESTGRLGKSGYPILLCRTDGFMQEASAGIVILAYDYTEKKWGEYRHTIAPDAAKEIVERLKLLGIPERLPMVEGIHLTAPVWINLSLKIKFNNQRFYLDLWAAEGIKGKDAENLRELFKYLFNLAGYSGSSAVIYKNYYSQ